MSGYLGNPDAESEHALILAENGINDSRMALAGGIFTHCNECGEEINPKRVEYARKAGIACMRCIDCQNEFDLRPKQKTRMLDYIL